MNSGVRPATAPEIWLSAVWTASRNRKRCCRRLQRLVRRFGLEAGRKHRSVSLMDWHSNSRPNDRIFPTKLPSMHVRALRTTAEFWYALRKDFCRVRNGRWLPRVPLATGSNERGCCRQTARTPPLRPQLIPHPNTKRYAVLASAGRRSEQMTRLRHTLREQIARDLSAARVLAPQPSSPTLISVMPLDQP